jgi:hypothetical protein
LTKRAASGASPQFLPVKQRIARGSCGSLGQDVGEPETVDRSRAPTAARRPSGPVAGRRHRRCAPDTIPPRAASAGSGQGLACVPVAISGRSNPDRRPSASRTSRLHVHPGGGHAEQPLGLDVDHLRDSRMVHWLPAGQDHLGQRWAIIGCAPFADDHRQRTGEPLGAQRLRCAKTSQRGADDDDAPGRSSSRRGRVVAKRHFCTAAARGSSDRLMRIACTGQAAAARSTYTRTASSGA